MLCVLWISEACSYSTLPEVLPQITQCCSSWCWCNSLGTEEFGRWKGKTNVSNHNSSSLQHLWTFWEEWRKCGVVALCALQSVWVWRRKSCCCRLSWGGGVTRIGLSEQSGSMVVTLILSGLQHGQESCWHFSGFIGWMRMTWHLGIFVEPVWQRVGVFNTFYSCTGTGKIPFFYLIHCGFF